MLSVSFYGWYAACCYAECRRAECRGALWTGKKKTAALLRGRFDEQKLPLGVTKLVTNRWYEFGHIVLFLCPTYALLTQLWGY